MTPMIDFRKLYEQLSVQTNGNQKKIAVESSLEVFFGYSFGGNLRLSFLSTAVPPSVESTSIIKVVQGKENAEAYWTSFDLLNLDLKDAYLSFCENMIDSIVGIGDQLQALVILKRRFITWKKLFQRASETVIPKEKLMGLFGELTVLKDLIAPQYGINTAVQAWGGPDLHSKDFTMGDTWFEVKTIGANSDSIHISSLSQLSSDTPGTLVVLRAEAVSPESKDTCCSIIDVINQILLLVSDETVENLLTSKIQQFGIDLFGKEVAARFDIKSVTQYAVSEGFPRITENNVPYPEITEVNYTISRASINRFIKE